MGGVFLLLSKISFYGTTLILIVLILVLSLKFNKKTENKIIEEVSNEYIASYFDGEYQTEIPGKDDGYVVDKIVCDNGTTADWDNEEWGINIRNATQKIKCGVYFKKLVKLADQIATLASTDTTNFASDDPDSNIRYIGAKPNNYVYFNCSDYSNQNDSTCEKWRIIGLFNNVVKSDNSKDNLVKIISLNAFSLSFDADSSYQSTSNYSTSTLKEILNNNYYNSDSNKIPIYGMSGGEDQERTISFGNSGIKNDNTRNIIENVVWNLGGISSSNNSVASFYNAERSSTIFSGTSPTWTGKIGLPYPSDYGYATADGSSNRQNCLNENLSDVFKNDCGSNNFFLKDQTISNSLTLTPSSSGYIYYFGYNTYFFGGIPTMLYSSAHPTLYLKSSVTILSGDGSSTNPYQLNIW